MKSSNMRGFALPRLSSLLFIATATLSFGVATASAETSPDKVIVTRNKDDVKGLVRLGDVNATARKFFGDPSALRAKATVDIQEQGAKLGASFVLITADDFQATPINNVSLIGTAYGAAVSESAGGGSGSGTGSGAAIAPGTGPAAATVITAKDFDKVIVTRNPDDVKGLTRAGDLSATARKFFGDPTALRATATLDLQKQAAKLGAALVLITADNFAATPINNVNLIGTAYMAAVK